MFTSPRVVVIDDNRSHLDALVTGLHQHGVGCLPIHYLHDDSRLKECPNLRVLFIDLNLLEGGDEADSPVHRGVIGGLIEETLKPRGSYLIVLWTRYPAQASALMSSLDSRLISVAIPFGVIPLDKSDYYNAQNVLDDEKLLRDIADISGRAPGFSALLDWEDRVLGAAGDTVASVLELARPWENEETREAEVSRLVYNLAVAGAGPNYFDDNRFRAVNDALLPVLADRISSLEGEVTNDVWEAAFDVEEHSQRLSQKQTAQLYRLVHIAVSSDSTHGNERGAVVALPDHFTGDQFVPKFGIEEATVASEEFFCKSFQVSDQRFRWVLVQSQPACDYSLKQPGTLPYYLGLELPAQFKRTSGSPRNSLWGSPRFDLDGVERLLHVSARFSVSVSSQDAVKMNTVYRLREQLLSQLIHHVHSYSARPGIISF